jgi:diguanylate cyclase (GGDEF)-like protein/PAS domain S-box-containing protein
MSKVAPVSLRHPLPIDSLQPDQARQPCASQNTRLAQSATVLIVDDNAINRRLLQALLKPEGYTIQCACSGPQALSFIAECAPDLILLDVAMPGMDGYAVAKRLKADVTTCDIPIIMVTGKVDAKSRLAGLEAGAEEFLTKPIDRSELWLRVRNLLRLKASSDLLRRHAESLASQVQARNADLQRFRTAMNATADAIFLVDRQTMRFVEVNTTACELLGYSRAEMFERGPANLGNVTVQQIEGVFDAVIDGLGPTQQSEVDLRRKDGSIVTVEVERLAQRFGNSWLIVALVRDVGERKATERQLHRLANYDALTNLPNRSLFHETLRNNVSPSAGGTAPLAVLIVDLDQFRNVNDTLGHAIGDELLLHFSARLLRCITRHDAIGRLGGDEFGLMLTLDALAPSACVVAEKIRDVLRAPFDLQGHEVVLTASIGITFYPEDATDAETLLKYADIAMYRAKKTGRDTRCFFTAQMNLDAIARHDLEMALRRAVDNDEFVIYYQPKVRLSDGTVSGLEALLRWQRPGHGLISPSAFIPMMEECGLIVRVGNWVIDTVCRQIGEWLRSPIGEVAVSVNVAERQFVESDLAKHVVLALARNEIPADLLELELTEGSLMSNTERTLTSLQELKQQGVKISIDDFGTGYSSLAYLRRFPIDKLKIDIAFIRDIIATPDDAAITLAIIRLAHNLKLEVIAEGVETAAQLAFLRHHGCEQIQGYYFSAPLPLLQTEALLREGLSLSMPPIVRPTRNVLRLC